MKMLMEGSFFLGSTKASKYSSDDVYFMLHSCTLK